MTTGTVMPRMSLVRSLNWDTNCPMFTPCWPSAGPTGGAGVACPPVTCKRICAVTCRAIPDVLVLGSGRSRSRLARSHQMANGGVGPVRLLYGAVPTLVLLLYLNVLDLPILQIDTDRPA